MSPPTKKAKPSTQVHLVRDILERSPQIGEPSHGICNTTIYPDAIAHIPGVTEHWHHEVQNRVDEILSFQNRNLTQKAISLFKKKNAPPAISGEELLQWHPTKKAQALAQALKTDPTDMNSRLELVSAIGRTQRDFPLEVFRLLLIHAAVACCFGKISSEGLQVVVWAQGIYMAKLFTHCKVTLNKIQGFLESLSAEEDASRREQRSFLIRRSEVIQTNMSMIQSYQKNLKKVASIAPPAVVTLDLKTLPNLIVGSRNQEGQKDEKIKVFKGAYTLFQTLRHLAILRAVTEELADLMVKIEPKRPISLVLKGKLALTTLTYCVSQYESGHKTPEVQKQIQTSFKEAYHHYGIAAKQIGQAQNATDSNILFEHAQTVHYFYRLANNMGLKLPRDWVESVLVKALRSLSVAEESPQVDELRRSIMDAMSQEGFSHRLQEFV